MSDRSSKTLSDLTDSWPSEPGNEDLARLGQDLFAGRPELSQLALDRIEIRMRQEMNRPWWQRHWRALFASLLGVAALSVGVYAWIANSAHNARRHDVGTAPQSAPVRDQFDVTLAPTSPKAPDKAVIDLQGNGDLFGREAKERKP